jgi:glycosyltransferase involved in cell wall biosynthesis/2-polyprenyl-3-methyl-5-hydroxy-6-metoxy-1,4-benzoquinol methylase
MRVLVVHNRYRSTSPGGEDRVVDQERDALRAAGHTVERFERFNDDIESWSLARRLAIPAHVVWNGEARRDLTHVIARARPDVVHVHNTFPLLSPSILYACRAAAVPVVVTLHNYRLACASGELFRDGQVCHDCLGHRSLAPGVQHGCYRGGPLATAPIALSSSVHLGAWRTIPAAFLMISERQRQILQSLELPAERVFVKPNLVPAQIVPAVRPAPRHIVVYAGRLAPSKGVPLLMEAWDRFLASGGGELRLLIAGAGPLEAAVRRWAAERESVELCGMLSRADCAALVASARAAVVPSAWEEAFGLVAVEAMALGVAPVAAAHGSFPELIEDGRSGVLVEPGNADALARVFADIDTHPETYARYGCAARDAYTRRFDPDANVEQLLAAYRFAIDHPTAARGYSRGAEEDDICEFWDTHPCGQEQDGAPRSYDSDDPGRFFEEYDRFKYSIEAHIPGCLDRLDLAGRRVLEIGTGEGTESEQLIRRGARWTGVDLTLESIRRVRARLALHELPFDDLRQASAVDLPFADGSFDLVFSHGVLHHVPDIHAAQREIRRVLRPGGELVVMVYARWSLNYLVAIGLIRRAALLAAYPFVRAGIVSPSPMVAAHVRNAEREGLLRYLRMRRFVHSNTDGPDNPFARVYDRRRLREDFPDFVVTQTYRRFMHAPPLPVHGASGERFLGWHLWAHLRPRPSGEAPARDLQPPERVYGRSELL